MSRIKEGTHALSYTIVNIMVE